MWETEPWNTIVLITHKTKALLKLWFVFILGIPMVNFERPSFWKLQQLSLDLCRASLTAGTAQRRRTRPKGGTTPCWDVSCHNSFHPVWKRKKHTHYRKYCGKWHVVNIPLLFYSCSLSDDRHRVKLHPLLGDPNSDYINANYIDVSLILCFLPLFDMGYK